MENELFDDWLADNNDDLVEDFLNRNFEQWRKFINEEFEIWREQQHGIY